MFSWPGPTFVANRSQVVAVTFTNNITTPHLFQVDPTLHWANPNNLSHPTAPFSPGLAGNLSYLFPVPLIPHLHGLEARSDSDGHPEAWWTFDGKRGASFSSPGAPATTDSATFVFPNRQPPVTAWYHDHALGITRLNVMAGLAGFYLVRDPNDPLESKMPSGQYDVPLMLQDRMFNSSDGSLVFPIDGDNPSVHPFWRMQFLGDVICVNGVAWPSMNVSQGQYMFRLLNGANARFFNVSFAVNNSTSNLLGFTVVANDGGYIRAPVIVSHLLLGPGERFNVIVDFSSLSAGIKVVMRNSAEEPFGSGPPPDAQTTGMVMQFVVGSSTGFVDTNLPAILNSALLSFPSLPTPVRNRTMVLFSFTENNLPSSLLLNGMHWMAGLTEDPVLNTTEEWTIVNLAADVHPIHLHLVPFQVVRRQAIDLVGYRNAWLAQNGQPPLSSFDMIDPTPYLLGSPVGPDAIDQSFQDVANVGNEAVTFRVRFGPVDGSGAYPFDATAGPGYVWHCHVLDHEDNDMMRPMKIFATAPITTTRTTLPPPPTTTVITTVPPTATPRNCTVVQVSLGSLQVSPQNIVVQIGDTIQWTFNSSVFHQVASVNGSLDCTPNGWYDSGAPARSPFQYTVKADAAHGFSTVGQTYQYMCQIHCVQGMRGSIFVEGVCDNSALTTSVSTSVATSTSTTGPAITVPPTTTAMAAAGLQMSLVVLLLLLVFV